MVIVHSKIGSKVVLICNQILPKIVTELGEYCRRLQTEYLYHSHTIEASIYFWIGNDNRRVNINTAMQKSIRRNNF